MTRVLLVGLQPEAVDYSDPALPPGMDAKKIQAGIELGLKQMTDRGWQTNDGRRLFREDRFRARAIEILFATQQRQVSTNPQSARHPSSDDLDS